MVTMIEILKLILQENQLFFLCLGLIFLGVLFVLCTTIRNHLLMRELITWNQENGVIMDFEFGWGGVRIISKPGTGKGTPDQSSNAPAKV